MDSEMMIRSEVVIEHFAFAFRCGTGWIFGTFLSLIDSGPAFTWPGEYFQTKRQTPSLSSDEAVAI